MKNDSMLSLRPGRSSFILALDGRMQVFGADKVGDFTWISGVLKFPVDVRINIFPITVPIRIGITDFWIRIPPEIWIAESPVWLRTGADWHVFSDRRICFELGIRWSEHIEILVQGGVRDPADMAVQWLLNGAAQVLHVQYTCHALNLDSWPEDAAPSWPHGKAAVELYEVEKQSHPHTKKNDQKISRV